MSLRGTGLISNKGSGGMRQGLEEKASLLDFYFDVPRPRS